MSDININSLHERHPGLTQSLGETYTEAASVCMSRHHTPPVTVSVHHNGNILVRNLHFPVPDQRVLNAHANEIDATEMGAYGLSLAAVESVAGLVAVRRAETLTGADWYIAPLDADLDDLESCIRLEVSGTDTGGATEIKRRLLEKVAQTSRGQSNLPAIAAVVGFKVLEIAISPLGAAA